MCKYCDMTEVNVEHACEDYFIHKSFRLQDDFNGKVIGNSGSYPHMYLREYKKRMREAERKQLTTVEYFNLMEVYNVLKMSYFYGE